MSPLSSFAGLLVPEFAEDMSAGRWERMNMLATKAINATFSYSIISAVFLFLFSEELGYVIYNSYDAGFYISTLAFVVPIMYLDHVTDFMLKGIGEQVFSMWINISDSLLSVLLVWFLIPRMGIMGYAAVILIMEGYNFALSFYRLKRKINFRINYISSFLIPLIISILSASVTAKIFQFGGSTSQPLWLIFKMVFALCIVIFAFSLMQFIKEIKVRKPNLIKRKSDRI
jgi:stage V sporulation protein B